MSLVNRLRGIYDVPVNDGAGLLGGKDTFTRSFAMPPICLQAADEIEALTAKLAAAKKDANAKQAKIDALMLEWCPDEMTPEQLKEWGNRQQVTAQQEPK